jgi:hypothetical protein
MGESFEPAVGELPAERGYSGVTPDQPGTPRPRASVERRRESPLAGVVGQLRGSFVTTQMHKASLLVGSVVQRRYTPHQCGLECLRVAGTVQD